MAKHVKYAGLGLLIIGALSGCSGNAFTFDRETGNVSNNGLDRDSGSQDSGATGYAGESTQSRYGDSSSTMLQTSGGKPNETDSRDSGVALGSGGTSGDAGKETAGKTGAGGTAPLICVALLCPTGTFGEIGCCRNATLCGVVFKGSGHDCIAYR